MLLVTCKLRFPRNSDGPLASRTISSAADMSSNRAREPSGLRRGKETGNDSSSREGRPLSRSSAESMPAFKATDLESSSILFLLRLLQYIVVLYSYSVQRRHGKAEP
ncbi:hypothetical protein H113_07395 [Trichophyton rubrum MR1459]|uniref:Uncharacterized protein n=1 Tax=Trichophyton rubrum (strain ATCC MYA-4607 / CBS 118892) TaxID=559305 RepID=A0A080WJN8_TRIRC|nr:uncharacterized protein TERG_11875 [Trichophyton rubrum CBS 118892]EZF91628.1 hypothetical protein H113_07395 [Trichophyton rubrum MR1459]KFL60927.1 hypothetical protein TERG_11875 [Trichophyton rubrum CBS 118892]